MSVREWAHGDVAMITALNRTTPYLAYYDGDVWHEMGSSTFCVVTPTSLRSVVVIDPESEADVDRLTKAVVEAAERHGNVIVSGNGIHPDTTAAALREFANPTPPKPEEPTGLGAVVEDAAGTLWVRHQTTGGGAWYADGIDRLYTSIAVVKVLSEGVTE